MRKLASVEKIVDIQPIEGKDKIELTKVLGWNVVVQKGEFKLGDLCVYIEPDTLLPEKEEFEFLRKRCYSKKYGGFRIRVMKLGSIYSQGIVFPLSILDSTKVKEGQDVSSILNVKAYDPEELNPQQKKTIKYYWFKRFLIRLGFKGFDKKAQSWPKFAIKSDETRLGAIPEVLQHIENERVYVTEKLDGCVSGHTRIMTDKGTLLISNIVTNKIPLKILSFNKNTGQNEFKQIVNYHKYKYEGLLYKIGVGNKGKGNRPKYINCTPNHRFFTNNGYKRADELDKNDVLNHYTTTFSQLLKEVLIGCILGDSSMNTNSKTGIYRTVMFSQSIKQKEYFDYKSNIFGSFFLKSKNTISGFGSTILNGQLVSNLEVLNFLNYILPEIRKKYINDKLLEEITGVSLAFWYMDDGSIINRNKNNLKERAIIFTNRYSYEENLMLKEMFRVKFNIDVSIGDEKIYKGHILIFNAKNAEKLFNIISPYICESMKYKLPIFYENMPCYFKNVRIEYRNGITETKIIDIKTEEFKGTVYDLTIEDNHNYFANSVLTHNCSALYWYNKGKFGVCSRNIWLVKNRKGGYDNGQYFEMALKYDIEKKLKKLNRNIGIQGEIVGTGIQGNKLKLAEKRFYVYQIQDLDKGTFVNADEFRDICEQLDLQEVPIIRWAKLTEDIVSNNTVDDWTTFSVRKSEINPDVWVEGIVVRTVEEKTVFNLMTVKNRCSFKVINPEFILAYD